MSYNAGKRRSSGVDSTLVVRFIATSFVYLLAGLIIFALNLLGVLNLNRDAIFVLWLFGSVIMIVFGLSYMFSSGLSRNSALINTTAGKEYLLLNGGVILFFAGLSGAVTGQTGKAIAIIGLLAIIVTVTTHLINIVLMASAKRTINVENQKFNDDY